MAAEDEEDDDQQGRSINRTLTAATPQTVQTIDVLGHPLDLRCHSRAHVGITPPAATQSFGTVRTANSGLSGWRFDAVDAGQGAISDLFYAYFNITQVDTLSGESWQLDLHGTYRAGTGTCHFAGQITPVG